MPVHCRFLTHLSILFVPNSFLVPLTTTGLRKALIGSQFVQQANCHTTAKISPTLFSSLDFSLVEFITPPNIL